MPRLLDVPAWRVEQLQGWSATANLPKTRLSRCSPSFAAFEHNLKNGYFKLPGEGSHSLD
jgi:hypothetical protein